MCAKMYVSLSVKTAWWNGMYKLILNLEATHKNPLSMFMLWNKCDFW